MEPRHTNLNNFDERAIPQSFFPRLVSQPIQRSAENENARQHIDFHRAQQQSQPMYHESSINRSSLPYAVPRFQNQSHINVPIVVNSPYYEPNFGSRESFGWAMPAATEQYQNAYACHQAHQQGYPLPYGNFPNLNNSMQMQMQIGGGVKCTPPPPYNPDKKSAHVYLMELEDALTMGRVTASQWLFHVRPLLKPDSLKHWFNEKQFVIASWEHFKNLFRAQFDSPYYENKRQNELLSKTFDPTKDNIREFLWEIKHLSHDVFPYDTYEKRMARLIDKLPIQIQSRIGKLKLYSYDQLVTLAESVNYDVSLEEKRIIDMLEARVDTFLRSEDALTESLTGNDIRSDL